MLLIVPYHIINVLKTYHENCPMIMPHNHYPHSMGQFSLVYQNMIMGLFLNSPLVICYIAIEAMTQSK